LAERRVNMGGACCGVGLTVVQKQIISLLFLRTKYFSNTALASGYCDSLTAYGSVEDLAAGVNEGNGNIPRSGTRIWDWMSLFPVGTMLPFPDI
jgi:hypothetical protein